MENALFDWPIVLQYDVKAKYRLISRKFSAVSVRLTNQIALFPFVCCFCFVRAFLFQGHTKIALLLERGPRSHGTGRFSTGWKIWLVDTLFTWDRSIFWLCSQRTLIDYMSKFSYGWGGSVCGVNVVTPDSPFGWKNYLETFHSIKTLDYHSLSAP